MSKTLFISAVIHLICILIMRTTPYYEGMAFEKYWLPVLGVFPTALITGLVFIIFTFSCVINLFRKRRNIKNFIIIGITPILITILFLAPFPSYVDGMHTTMKAKLSRDEIAALVTEAREKQVSWLDREKHRQLIKALRKKYPTALNLSPIEPRIEISERYVKVFYGSALVKHWGYLFTNSDTFPLTRIPEGMYKKVYDGVWVYHDIW